MADDDRERWNAKYRRGGHQPRTPSASVTALAEHLPSEGRVLDVAGGAGANAVWLAQRGLDVTIVDVSEVGLAIAVEAAVNAGVSLDVVQADLERDPLPPGPWALVLCSHYLQPELLPVIADELQPGGCLLWVHPTTTNLERHERPSRRFLLPPGEAVRQVESVGLRVRWAEEGWVGADDDARCLATVVAEKVLLTTN